MATFLVDRPPGRAWRPGVDTREQPLWPEHAAFMDDLFDRGFVVLGGPLADGSGVAVLVMDAESETAIRELLAPDPWCEQEILGIGEIREWRLFLAAPAIAPK